MRPKKLQQLRLAFHTELPLYSSLPLSLSHTHMHTHLGTFTLSISMRQSAAAAAAFECCAWYAAFGKCEYELHKSSRGNGGSLCQLRQARPGEAEQGRPRPVLALRLFGFGLQRERAQKRREDTEQRQEGTTVVGPLALVRATASPAMGDTRI